MNLYVTALPANARPDRLRVDAFVALAHTHAHGQSCQVRRDRDGRPGLTDARGAALSVVCSISHSQHWLACAFAASGTLGIDIECPRPRDEAAAGAWFFGDQLGERLTGLAPAQRTALFYRAWTAYEALYKCGITRRRGMVDVLWPDPAAGDPGFQLRWLRGPDEIHACVVVAGSGREAIAEVVVLQQLGDKFEPDRRWSAAAPAQAPRGEPASPTR